MKTEPLTNPATEAYWTVVYDSQTVDQSLLGRFASVCRAICDSRPLAWQLFRRNLLANYRQSFLGWLWMILPPLASAGVWVFLNASGTLRISSLGIVGYAAFVFIGMLMWQAFIEGLVAPMNTLQSNRAALTKLQFPREVFITLSLLETGFEFLTRAVVGVLILIIAGLVSWPGVLTLLFVWGPALIVLGTACGLWLAPFGLLYKDVGRTITLVSPLWMLLTPVIYPLPPGTVGSLQAWVNPPAAILHVARHSVVAEPAEIDATSPSQSAVRVDKGENQQPVPEVEGQRADNPSPEVPAVLYPAVLYPALFWLGLGLVLFAFGAVWLDLSGPIVIERLAN